MRKTVLLSCFAAAMVASAQKADTTRTKHLGEAQVVTNRATNKTPLAFSNLDKKAIEKVNFGQDIPFLLSTLPNVVTTSDAGTGIGYTSMRVRGTVGERINVTNNGIPLNDPEAHTFYWVDTPDLVSSVNDIQLQRGVGTSTNGAAAFGASVNMTTDRLSASPYALYAGSFGSFNTTKNTVKAGTGLFANHWTFDARLSYLSSEGYRDRSSARLGSYFAQLAYINEGTTLKLIAFGGKERTYHAWDGISREQLKTNRTYNPNGYITATKSFYDNQIDYYFQQHVQALLTQRIDEHWNFNAALHYTYGFGYYEEYKKYNSSQVHVLAFIDRMEQAYAVADVIISRAGASSVSELCVVGKPVIFIPSPNVAEDHQTKNARAIADKQAAILIKENELDSKFADTFSSLITDETQQQNLSSHIKVLAQPNATKEIVDLIINNR